jgi:hypothetical protein
MVAFFLLGKGIALLKHEYYNHVNMVAYALQTELMVLDMQFQSLKNMVLVGLFFFYRLVLKRAMEMDYARKVGCAYCSCQVLIDLLFYLA